MGVQMQSTSHSDYPPKTMEPFLGSYAPIKQGYNSLYQQQGTNFFQDYRNETLSKFTMASYQYGFTRTPYSPQADLVSAYKKANWKRILETPNVKLRLIDEARSQEVDNFYKVCQMHREQYKDHTGLLHPLHYFKIEDYCWQNYPTLSRTYMDFPTYYAQNKKPVVSPKTFARTVPIPILPDRSLAGRYWAYNDNAYNR